jgi:plastocyanin
MKRRRRRRGRRGPQRGQVASARRSGTVARRFARAGRYTIVCDIHPGMMLRLRVG